MYTLYLSPRKLALILVVIVTGLLLGGVATQYIKYVYGYDSQLGLVRLFNLGGENNLPAWYSSVMLLLSSGVLGIIGLHHRREANLYGWHWLALALIFLGLSVDEAASIHERMGDPLVHRWLEAIGYLDSALLVIGTAWVLAGVLFAVIVFLLFWRFLQDLPLATKALFLIAGALYIAGAIGLEAVGGQYLAHHGGNTLTYSMMVAVEEGLEMFGVVVFLYALMLYMATQGIGFQVVLNSGSHPGDPYESANEIADTKL
jgi:hypothetical protein